MHQSIETPTPWVSGKGRGFDIDPGQKASISLPLRLEFRSIAPTPAARKMKVSKLSRKKEMCLNGEIFQVYMYKYAALIKLLVQQLIINLDIFVQHRAVPCISLLLQDYLQSHGKAPGRKMAVAFANIFMAKIECAILSQSNITPIFWERFIDDIVSIRSGAPNGSVQKAFNPL